MLDSVVQLNSPFGKDEQMSTYSFQQLWPYQDYLGAYFSQLDGDVAVMGRIAAAYAVSEASPPAMEVVVGAGAAFRNGTVVEVPARTTAAITAPATNPRIDRIVSNPQTDAILVVHGTEAASPTPPLVPAGYLPLARITLTPNTIAITNTAITDERVTTTAAASTTGGLVGVQTFASSGTYVPTPGTNSVIVEAVGGGGSGGGCGATNGSQGSGAGGGSAGSFARARLTADFANVAVTVGAGGAATSADAVNGNPGASSSFGTLVVAPGGNGGFAGFAYTPPAVVGGGYPGDRPTGGTLVSGVGGAGNYASILSLYTVVGGVGATSIYGGGGRGEGNLPGQPGGAPGAGGGGASSIANAPARSGGEGGHGVVIVYEYA
jgi:hypothetical protein